MVSPKYDSRDVSDAFTVTVQIILEISQMSTDKSTYAASESIKFSFNVRNKGTSTTDFRSIIKIKTPNGSEASFGPGGITPDTLSLSPGSTWTFSATKLTSTFLDQWGTGTYSWGLILINTGSMDKIYNDTGYQKSFILGSTENAAITVFTPPSESIIKGQIVSASVTIRNTGTSTRSFWVGITWWDSAGGTHDLTPKQSSILAPGDQAIISFNWTIPSSTPSGYCDLTVAVWNGYSGGLMVSPKYDSKDVLAAYTIIAEKHDTITFSGYTWQVVNNDAQSNPGMNYWSNSEENVWIDDAGQLHLRITHRDGKWYCAEVYTTDVLGYGTYTFTTASRIDQLDQNIILGLFASNDDYREVDIEYSKWCIPNNNNGWFTIQPQYKEGQKVQTSFPLTLSGIYSTHSFTWSINEVSFIALHGAIEPARAPLINVIKSWATTTSPDAEGAHGHINFWLNETKIPSNGQEAEIVIKSFSFTPSTPASLATASLSTQTQTIASTSLFKVDLVIDPNGNGVSASEVILRFDPSAMSITDVTIGTLLGTSPIKAIDTRNNQAGTYTVALARVGQTQTPTLKGTLLTITFKAQGKPGSYEIQLEEVKLSDTDVNDISNIAMTNCSINITSQASADVNGDGIVDYKDLALLGQSYGKAKGETGYNSVVDINSDDIVDYKDLALLGARYTGG
jgi:hypothetical protein